MSKAASVGGEGARAEKRKEGRLKEAGVDWVRRCWRRREGWRGTETSPEDVPWREWKAVEKR